MKEQVRETGNSTLTIKRFCERLCTNMLAFSFVILLAMACIDSLFTIPIVVFYALLALFIFSIVITYYCNERFTGFFEAGFVDIEMNSSTGVCIEMVY